MSKGPGASFSLMAAVTLCFLGAVMTAPRRKSHVMMWMVTEKQLIPRIAWLTQAAHDLLNHACTQVKENDCKAFANSLPSINGIGAVPSKNTLKKEKKKQFVKVLVLDGYKSLKQLEGLLDDKVLHAECNDSDPCVCHKLSRFQRSLHNATDQYKELVTSFYSARQFETKTKEVRVAEGQFTGGEQDVVIKVLSIAEDRLNEIMSVLEYSVELSWLTRMNNKPKQ